ncbi:MAG: sigma 54-interacting transcriptional regulator [Candidatus Riflebacteria bacterium]|nr:sigma 54-interacting transcriptional regulator [Candidatus Riflebacteria bacterium]
MRFNCASAGPAVERRFFGEAVSLPGTDIDGALHMANRGTLVLDQVERFPQPAQYELLNFLDTGVFSRIGSPDLCEVDVKIVALTARDLKSASEGGLFLEQLYYRLSRLEFVLPRLADRADDVALLAQHFLTLCAARRPAPKGFDQLVMSLFKRYTWEGNVRELKNTVDSAALLASTKPSVEMDDLPHKLAEYYRENQNLFAKDILSTLAEEERKSRRFK